MEWSWPEFPSNVAHFIETGEVLHSYNRKRVQVGIEDEAYVSEVIVHYTSHPYFSSEATVADWTRNALAAAKLTKLTIKEDEGEPLEWWETCFILGCALAIIVCAALIGWDLAHGGPHWR